MSTGTLSHKLFRTTVEKGLAPRQFNFTISSPTLDRDRDIIELSAWNLREYQKNPVVLASHDHQRLPVGKSVSIGVRNESLKATVEFPPIGVYAYADTVHDLVEAGFLSAASVGFRADDCEPNGHGGKTIKRATLLEWSICSIGSNPDAMVERAAPLVMQKWLQSKQQPREADMPYVEIDDDEPYLEVSDDFFEKVARDDFDALLARLRQRRTPPTLDDLAQLVDAGLRYAGGLSLVALFEYMNAHVPAMRAWDGQAQETWDVDEKELALAIGHVVAHEVGAQTRAALNVALGRLD